MAYIESYVVCILCKSFNKQIVGGKKKFVIHVMSYLSSGGLLVSHSEYWCIDIIYIVMMPGGNGTYTYLRQVPQIGNLTSLTLSRQLEEYLWVLSGNLQIPFEMQLPDEMQLP